MFFFNFCNILLLFAALDPLPTLYQGRFRPVDTVVHLSKAETDDLLMLPDKFGVWHPLRELQNANNFTVYSDASFERIRTAYLNQDQEKLAKGLREAYAPLAGTPYQEAVGKALYYPSFSQLEAEKFYFKWPLIVVTIAFYGLALVWRGFIFPAFGLHTLLLALRCYILMRPPVSNMFETVLYVPWIATLAALLLRSKGGLMAASFISIALLTLLKVTGMNSSMENVQAVLDSQYWLIIHVLMVVGSYGLFALSGILGHVYLLRESERLAGTILQTMYIGVALLIPGTILGGIWAAQSWGRFWDWDPKEAWAFISASVYLLFIHAYRFQRIGNFGLAVGSIVGLQAIGFTWYGVNYILGTGLHSYGFGSGGVGYYCLLLVLESLFVGYMCYKRALRGTLT